MLPEWVIKYIGGGFLIIIGYIIISNTLWLLMGAKAIQYLPGVNDKSAKGTIKFALILLMSLIGFLFWLLKLIPSVLGIIKYKPITKELSVAIQKGSKAYQKIERFFKK